MIDGPHLLSRSPGVEKIVAQVRKITERNSDSQFNSKLLAFAWIEMWIWTKKDRFNVVTRMNIAWPTVTLADFIVPSFPV